MQSLPVVIIRCEENEIYQLDFRIQTDNIRCFILLSGLRKSYIKLGYVILFPNFCVGWGPKVPIGSVNSKTKFFRKPDSKIKQRMLSV